ncbi:MAG: FliM/FliN family flagellar motor switch protein [Candidatus Eremiobacteraeota bacterium]|nr:FliM/FliN family flagellar motor switch protein [Candidatus Eremiobacteraeota bacterium]
MRALTFDARTRFVDGRSVRRVRFATRSALPINAACVVANGVREMLASVLGTTVTLRLIEPLIPTPEAWQVVLGDALIYRVAGSIADAALVMARRDAVALVGAAFGEPAAASTARALSAVEHDVLDRMVDEIAVNLGPLCGIAERHRARRIERLEGFETFFELIIDSPVQARIGIAVSRDPVTETRGAFSTSHLARVGLRATAALPLESLNAAEILELKPGALVRIRAADFARCRLTIHGRPLASGTCGTRNGRYAFALRSPYDSASRA